MPDFLYIHIPFCVKKCLYCDFLSVPYEESSAERYTDALCMELRLKKGLARPLRGIYLGGGTPSLLPGDCLKKIFTCLRENFPFSGQPEITAEANPGTFDRSKLHTMLSLGINRISMGVQSFIEDELTVLGRIHTAEEALASATLLKASGLANFSLDLMYGIPGQTNATWEKTLAAAVGLTPAHISAYELTPEKKTPFFDLITSGTVMKPSEETILEMYRTTINILAYAGYEHYEISNFARPGFRCLHNLNYWDRGEYLGAGVGAHSFIRNIRSKNTGDIPIYIESLNRGVIPETESTELSLRDAVRESLFLGLRKTEGIDISRLPNHGLSIPDAVKNLVYDGYLELINDHLRLTEKGILISNSIIVRLFDIFAPDT